MAASVDDDSRNNALLNEHIIHLVSDYLIDDDSVVELGVALGSMMDNGIFRRANLHRCIRTDRSQGIMALYRECKETYHGTTMFGIAISFGSLSSLSTLLSLQAHITNDDIAAAANLPPPHRLLALKLIYASCPPLGSILETIDDRCVS
jgi:hypothetical protein